MVGMVAPLSNNFLGIEVLTHATLTGDGELLNNSIVVVNRHVHVGARQHGGVTTKLKCCCDSGRTKE